MSCLLARRLFPREKLSVRCNAWPQRRGDGGADQEPGRRTPAPRLHDLATTTWRRPRIRRARGRGGLLRHVPLFIKKTEHVYQRVMEE